MTDSAPLWADPRLTYTVAAVAVFLLLAAIWLFGRKKRQGRQAGVICLTISLALHLTLIVLIPLLPSSQGNSTTLGTSSESASTPLTSFQFLDPDAEPTASREDQSRPSISPLPLANLNDLLDQSNDFTSSADSETIPETIPEKIDSKLPPDTAASIIAIHSLLPAALTNASSPGSSDPETDSSDDIDSQLGDMLDAALAASVSTPPSIPLTETPRIPQVAGSQKPSPSTTEPQNPTRRTKPTPAQLASATSTPLISSTQSPQSDFANRTGDAKIVALQQTGGNRQTEAAVAAALRFLARTQQPNGSWDPRSTGAGVERAALGTNRYGAGGKADTAITGLALLAMIGAGNTHQTGEYADNVYRGLAYLINTQSRFEQNLGSMAGTNTSVYAATYSHGIAALAMCEAAAISQDKSALISAQRAIAYTQRMQIPRTGGWRYTQHDRDGDLSQLGWQAMVLDAGHRAKIPISQKSVQGIQRFLVSVRSGQGGLACYRPREIPTRTMTAEALATRLLIGEPVPSAEAIEAQRYLLQQPPGFGQDNYYYWYYATLALHQLQDDAWLQWNEALKRRLLSTQLTDGRWSSNTVWGGYGGEIYTTSMATLCLETYYRHAIRNNNARIATRPGTQNIQR